MNHLGADTEIRRNLRHRPASSYQVKYLTVERRRVTSRHSVLHESLDG
jgi:hypothetical protein